MEQYTNALIKESSPYLLQHAHNPVDWVPWSYEIFEQAKKENKLVLISVGYSACHWCHVMEHECFEDEEVASLMNKFFINVKVDREERPDVDNIYMKAVQLMTRRGGWPLNCFTTPEGKPIYGGTYFPKEQWMHILKSLHHTFVTEPEKVEAYGNELVDGIRRSEHIEKSSVLLNYDHLGRNELEKAWINSFDRVEGGFGSAPKFPTPINLEFLLNNSRSENSEFHQHLHLTLEKMALGGIYDQIGGGFSRYAVDSIWKVPHFEKMLYDNAQLISIYSKAFRIEKNPLFKRVVHQTIEWVERELASDKNSYYSALDADSEGEEGRFYVWKKEELKNILQGDFSTFHQIYNLTEKGYWEKGNYILLRDDNDQELAQKLSIDANKFYHLLTTLNQRLLLQRNQRVKPGLDNKELTSWNALLLTGFCESYRSFSNNHFLELAENLARWITGQMHDNGIYRIKTDQKIIPGFIEDYAFTIQAFIDLYQVTFKRIYLENAMRLTEHTIEHFLNETNSMFNTSENNALISHSIEIHDSVLPAPNSVMAINLIKLARYFDRDDFAEIGKQQISNVVEDIKHYVTGYANWCNALDLLEKGVPELKIYNTESPNPELLNVLSSQILIINGSDKLLPVNNDSFTSEFESYVYCDINGCRIPQSNVSILLESIKPFS